MNLSELIQRYKEGSRILREAVLGMTPDQTRARPIPGKWSTLEVVSHVADFEVIGVDRLMAVIAEDEPVLPGRDEQRYAARLGYDQRDLESQLRLVEACREHGANILAQLTEVDLARKGIHTEAGPLSLEQLLLRVIRHLEHHVPFIREKRKALGV